MTNRYLDIICSSNKRMMLILPREQVWPPAPRAHPAAGPGGGVPAVQSCQVGCKITRNTKYEVNQTTCVVQGCFDSMGLSSRCSMYFDFAQSSLRIWTSKNMYHIHINLYHIHIQM